MLKQLIFIGVLTILSTTVFGQGKITLKEEKTSDLFPMSFYKTKTVGYLFKVEGEEYQGVGFKGEKIEEILKTDEEAYKEFRKFQRKISIAKASYWVTAVSPLAYAFSVDYDKNTEQQVIGKTITFGVVAIGGMTTTLVLFKAAPKHLHNAVQIYNRNLE